MLLRRAILEGVPMHTMLRTLLFMSLLSLSTGCAKGPELGDVTGRITLEGEPVEAAYVTFLPMFPGGMELVGKTDADGNYDVQYSATRKGIPPGKYQILLSTLDDIKNPNGSNTKVPERFHPIYVNNDSPLTFEVVPGENDASFDASKKPQKK